MEQHTVKAFDEDITRLRGLIAEMGGLAEAAVQNAMDALIQGDDALAERIIADDKKIDALEAEVDRLAVRIIALRAPMADDLREVIGRSRSPVWSSASAIIPRPSPRRAARSIPSARSSSR